MAKIENPDLIHIELRGKRAKITLSEYELSVDEWDRRRTAAFEELRKVGFIPNELIDLVEHSREQTPLQLFVSKTSEPLGLRFSVKVADKKSKRSPAQRLAEIVAAHKRMQNDDKKKEMTASEALAFFLRIFLRELKHAEKNRKAAPVRTLKLVPRSLIAEIAMDLLSRCGTWNHSPGPFLNSLIRELLNLERDRQGMSRNVDTQERAAAIVAQAPTVRTRELAKALHVNPSTISRWRRSPEFKQMVERKTETVKDRANVGERFLSFAQKGPMEKEAIALLLATAARLYGPKDIG